MTHELFWNHDGNKGEFKLENRLIKALQPSEASEKRSFGEIEPTHLPSPKINLEGIPGGEIFILMIENLQKHRVAETRSEAERTQANALKAADYLIDILPGDDSSVEFTVKAMRYLRGQSPLLGEHIDGIMNAAQERGVLRQERQQALFRKWYKAQKEAERRGKQ